MSQRPPRTDPSPPRLVRSISAVVGVLIVLAGLVLSPATVSAHTGFESSTPADGTAVDEPVSLVTIVFAGEAAPVGDEFIALTPDGVVQAATSFETVDDKTFSITFDPPLAGGQAGIRWNVQAADAHPIAGAFSFTVNAPAAVIDPAEQQLAPDVTETAVADSNSEAATAVDDSTSRASTITVGRVVGILGVALALGALAFVVTALRGRRGDV